VKTDLSVNPVCTYPGASGNPPVRGYCGPGSYKPERHGLFHSNGDGTFNEVSVSAGTATKEGRGLALVVADLDGDGRPDLYVANDKDPNFLFQNQSRGPGDVRFVETAMDLGAALLREGTPGASMGVACGDFDENGTLDLGVTEFLGEGYALHRNTGKFFVDASVASRLAAPTKHYLGFGTAMVDFDNDGRLDLFIANGHVLGPDLEPTQMRAQVFRNVGREGFVEVSDWAGPYFFNRFYGRGAAAGDWNNDGAVDIVVSNLNDRAALLRNDTPRRGNFLGIDLVGVRSCRSALNARAIVRVGSRNLMREITPGGSYLSDGDRRLLFGLGDAKTIDSLEIRWPSGRVEVVDRIPANRWLLLVEGRSPELKTPHVRRAN
jgi:hypothetical protein